MPITRILKTLIALLVLPSLQASAQVILEDGFESPPPDNFPPEIVSTPVTTANVDQLYTYDVDATDPDGDPLNYALLDSPTGMTIDAVTGEIEWTPDATGDFPVTVEVSDGNGGFTQQSWTITVTGPAPQEPTPSAIDETVPTTYSDSVEFLYEGPDAIQHDMVDGALEDLRVAVVRGTVTDRDGTPLEGVKVTALKQEEIGFTLTRADGAYDLAVNGGGPVVIQFAFDGYLTAQRTVNLPWNEYSNLDPVRLVPLSPMMTTVALSPTDAGVARGEVETDDDGSRQGTLIFQPGTTAEMEMPDGSLQPLNSLDVRVTEFTVGPNGPEAMPALLPPTSGYTYAAEYTVDEALAAGAVTVHFDPAVIFYLEDFVGFPVGTPVPLGAYERRDGQWEASPDGLVLKIVGISGGLAEIDLDGDDVADDPTTIGMTEAEREQLASIYSVGEVLWRAEISHFSPWDCNWPFGPPDDATPPQPDHGPARTDSVERDDDCPESGFSRVGCQTQLLREEIPLAGTDQALHYRSDRAENYSAGRVLDVSIPADEIPDIATDVRIKLEVAGTKETRSFPAFEDVSTIFVWNGTDAYGRTVYGPQPYKMVISFVYEANYSSSAGGGGGDGGGGGGGGSASGAVSFFGQPGVRIVGSAARQEIVLQRIFTGILGGPQPTQADLGDWTLTDHHMYAPDSGTLFLGNGVIRGDANGVDAAIVLRMQTDRDFNTWQKSAVPLPDGTVLLGVREPGENGRIWQVGLDGDTTLIAGTTSQFADRGDGGQARFARLDSPPSDMALLTDGSFLIAQGSGSFFGWSVRRVESVSPTAIIDTVAGGGSVPFEDNLDFVGPAVDLELGPVGDIAAGPDGAWYMVLAGSSSLSDTIWQVTPDGTAQRIAGAENGAVLTEGALALDVDISVRQLAVAPNSDIYFSGSANENEHSVWRISGGIMERVMGSGACSFNFGDEGPALTTELCDPGALAISPAGTVFVAAWHECGLNCWAQRIYRYDGQRFDIMAGGDGSRPFQDGGLALNMRMGNRDKDLYVMANGSLLNQTFTGSAKAYFIEPLYDNLDTNVPSVNGRFLYQFGFLGRHLSTFDNFLMREVRTFAYDTDGRLTGITDVDGRSTTIERDGAGVATAIVGPDGHRTELTVTNDKLAGATGPAGNNHSFGYSSGGGLTLVTDPKGNTSNYDYDPDGRLIQAVNRGGGTITLERTELGIGEYEVAVTRRGTEVTTYRIEKDGVGLKRTVIDPTGATTVVRTGADGVSEGIFPDGTVATYRLGADPRFGAQAARIVETAATTPNGLTTTTTIDVDATLADPVDPSTMTLWTETVTRDGKTSSFAYDVAARTLTETTAEGRTVTTTFDENGRIVSEAPGGGIAPVSYTYDADGRLVSMTQDTDSLTLAYDAEGNLISATDAGGGVMSWTHDAAGRLTSTTLPSGQAYDFTLDANGNLTAITMPETQVHTLTFDANDRLASYTLPTAGSKVLNFDGLGRREGLTYPDGSQRDDLYTGDQLTGSTLPSAVLTVGYLPEVNPPGIGNTQQVNRLVRNPDGKTAQELDLTLDGRLITDMTMTGPAAAAVTYTHTVPYQPDSRQLDMEAAIAYSYDDDDLLTGIGPFSFTRNADNGQLETIADATLTVNIGLDNRAELASREVLHDVATLYDLDLTRDERTRVVTRVETVNGVPTERNYAYDMDGRLIEVTDDLANVVESFTYDGNGNRLSDGMQAASYDDQDRLVNRAGIAYLYDANGFLESRGADTFDYTVDGVLRSATVAGDTVSYDYDFYGRRVTRTDAGGTTTYVYGDPDHAFRVTASIAPDATVSEYFYDDADALFAFRRGADWYYVGTDQVGSPRVVVAADTGFTVKTVEYSAFGEVLADTNPSFVLPVGFAGGLPDPDSDLVRIGLRDYEPAAGRFTGLDPLLLASGSPNLYAYVENDPINFIDLAGLLKLGASGYAGFGGGVSVTITSQGIGFCAEGGVGVGGGLGLDPLAGLKEAGLSAVGNVGVGPVGTGVQVPFNECWASGRPEFRWDGPTFGSDVANQAIDPAVGGMLDQLGKESNGLFGRAGKAAAKSVKGLGAEANLSIEGCLPPMTW